MIKTRLNSIAVVGGAFGDEGKGKIVDEIANKLIKRFGNAIVYRWSGGANAGHTVEIEDKKIVLHQIPSGALVNGALCILGKGMVIHPGDLVEEFKSISNSNSKNIIIDEMATLSLDTHRAYETILKKREEGWGASTGRGISPAYADILYRTPVKARDLMSRDWKEKLEKHYLLYKDLAYGLGDDIAKVSINSILGPVIVGNKNLFIKKLSAQRDALADSVKNVFNLIRDSWNSTTPFIFEGAQGIGLDARWGVYPDITAADPTPSGIYASSEGIIDPEEIEIRANVYKATYLSSVGKRILPAKMNEALATKIREEANEYGATTKRPRDIYHMDLPALAYFAKISKATHMVLTHMDISYPDTSIKVCTKYIDKRGDEMPYRPDQEYISSMNPVYEEFKPWNGKEIQSMTDFKDFPAAAKKYVSFISESLGLTPLMLTNGPKRNSVVSTNYLLL